MLRIGEVIGEFEPAGDADGSYTHKLKRVFFVMGRFPGEGGWKLVVLTDCGYTNEIPEKDIQKRDGRYITGGPAIVMHAAGMPEDSLDCAPIPEELRR